MFINFDKPLFSPKGDIVTVVNEKGEPHPVQSQAGYLENLLRDKFKPFDLSRTWKLAEDLAKNSIIEITKIEADKLNTEIEKLCPTSITVLLAANLINTIVDTINSELYSKKEPNNEI